jgi:hypothetical protein
MRNEDVKISKGSSAWEGDEERPNRYSHLALKLDGSLNLGKLRHLGIPGVLSSSHRVLVFRLKKEIVRSDAFSLRSSEELGMVAELSESKEHGEDTGVATQKANVEISA